MRIFHIDGDQFQELDELELPAALPASGYLWIGTVRPEFEIHLGALQHALQRWTGGQLVDLHISDLLNDQLPSHYDYTSWYDVLVFRRLAAAAEAREPAAGNGTSAALASIDTSPVGFALFDRVLLTVHPSDCQVRDYIANRLQHQVQTPPPDKAAAARPPGGERPTAEGRGAARLPPSPADLMLRMVNHMVDSYLDLRRRLTRHFEDLQQALFNPGGGRVDNWHVLLTSRNALHLLEDTCEDQRASIIEWIDALDEWPPEADATAQRERELLRVRSRDVLEHIERVLSHVRRLEGSAETAVQMHFSAQSNRTNEIMRALTVLTAIFLPLNLVTGFFGMNFEGLPLIHSRIGFWVTFTLMLFVGISMSVFFWRRRYLSTSR